ncbi:uncharacterized protein ABIA33_005618 [Streptacidiphilus sp. MAP12-16]|uniref:hypothetical protein n=1 Tax=Streptacidiphilus sp. MAP12-16 TaxID=3156300 RepID=UPI0035117790
MAFPSTWEPRSQAATYATEARPHYAGKDPAHDFVHVERILARVELLAEGEAPRRELLYFIACFHGLIPELGDTAFRRGTSGFLAGIGWSPGEVAEGIHALERHLTAPVSLEEMLVHDANYWEAIGAFGIAKAFTTGGARGQRIEETLRLARGFVERAVFRTPRAQQLAPARRAYAHAFLDDLERELDSPLGRTPSQESGPA